MQSDDETTPSSQEGHDSETTRMPQEASNPLSETPEVVADEAPSFYKPAAEDQTSQRSASLPRNDQTISWDGSEYIDHQKPAGWYALFSAAAAVVVALSYILTHDYMVMGSIAVAAILFGVMAARKPRTLHYVIDNRGVTIADKLYAFSEFKVFSVIADTAIHSVQLLPMKRFLPPLSLHYPPDQEQAIVTTLGSYLPYQEGGRDRVEQLMSRIRF